MIDNLALAVSHGLMMLAAFLLMRRRDLDTESPPGTAPPETAPPAGERPRA